MRDARWQADNRLWLTLSLARLGLRLETRINDETGPEVEFTLADFEARIQKCEESISDRPALRLIAERCRLTPFEAQVLLLCAGTELDGDLAKLCADTQGPDHYAPTFSFALAYLDSPDWDAISPDSPLRRRRLIELGASGSLSLAPLRIDERVLHYLTGCEVMEPRISARLCELDVDPESAPTSARTYSHIVSDLLRSSLARTPRTIELVGTPEDRIRCAVLAASELNAQVISIDAGSIPTESTELDRFTRLCERELLLDERLVYVDSDATATSEIDARATIRRFGARFDGPLLVGSSSRPSRPLGESSVVLDLAGPDRAEQRALWHAALVPWQAPRPAVTRGSKKNPPAPARSESGRIAKHDDPCSCCGSDDSLNVVIDSVVAQFDFSVTAIRALSAEVLSAEPDRPSDDCLHSILWDSCRRRARLGVSGLAHRVEGKASWADLVVPEESIAALYDIVRQLRNRTTVFDDWGFAARQSRGLGTTALFHGPSGTGKTLAAEIIANELSLDLYVVDLSTIMDKYIGETEKNLRQIFDAGERSGAVLLFDEADSVFGRRSEVKDSHDRFANIAVSYLLTRMESYRGLAILTTNRREAIDEAFTRRIRFMVKFPFPDAQQRQKLWRNVFPAGAPVGELDYKALQTLDVSGATIRNIALSAAFASADSGTTIEMEHIAAAARVEMAKIDRPLTPAFASAFTVAPEPSGKAGS